MSKNLDDLMVEMNAVIGKPWDTAVEPFRIADRLYYVGTDFVSNYLIDSGDGLILIDTGVPEMLYLLLESIRKLGFDPMDIKLILLSHGHFDHCGATRHLQEMTGAKVMLGQEDVKNITGRPELMIKEIPGFVVDEVYTYGEPVQMGQVSVECLHTPAHTMGTTSFFFDVTDNGSLYRCGLHGGIGLVTLDEDYLREHSLPLEYQEIYLASLESLKDMKVDIVLPSHNKQYDIIGKAKASATKAFADKTAWRKFIETRIEMAKARFYN